MTGNGNLDLVETIPVMLREYKIPTQDTDSGNAPANMAKILTNQTNI
jgi:hypothetical protein